MSEGWCLGEAGSVKSLLKNRSRHVGGGRFSSDKRVGIVAARGTVVCSVFEKLLLRPAPLQGVNFLPKGAPVPPVQPQHRRCWNIESTSSR